MLAKKGFLSVLQSLGSVWLSVQQVNVSREEMFGQKLATSFKKPADWEDGGQVSQRTIFLKLEFRLFWY